MPQVPYSPVPDVTPTESGPGPMRIEAPGAAFGTNVAAAVESVGGQLDKAGNELFARAMALQDLQNRTEADQLFSDFTKDIGLKHEAYKSRLQQAAVTGLEPHLEDLERTRQSFADQSNNSMVKRLFNSESRSLVARTTISAASHAAQQNKVWQDSTAKSVMANNRIGAATSPDDEEGFQKKLDAVPTQVAVQAGAADWGPEQTAHEVFKERSQLWRDRIIGMARTSPIQAANMLAQNKTKMEYTDWKSADGEVRHQVVTAGSRVVADNINAGWDPRMKPQEIDRAAGIQEPLTRIVKYVQQNHPELRFTIPGQGGVRTPEEQAKLVAAGFSRTMHSAHLEGRGIDLAPVNANGQIDFNDKQAYERIEMAMKEASEALGIPLSPEHDQIKSWDPGHYSIPKNLDYSKVPDALEEPVQNRVSRGRGYASTQFPGDTDMQTVFSDAIEQRIRTGFNNQRADKRDLDYRNETTVGNAILGGYGDKLPTTPEELRAINPDVAQAYDALDPPAKRKMLKYLTQNSKDDFTANEERFRQYTKLQGEAETDPAAFLQRDVAGLELPRQWRQHLLTMQQQKFKSSTMNPAVAHALDVLKPMLTSSQITPQNKDDYQQFAGSLHAAIQDYMEREKKPPKDQDILEIGGRLLQQQHSDTFWFSRSTDFMYKLPVPERDSTKIKTIYKQEHGFEPSDEMVRRIYIRGQYQELYGNSKPKATGTK